MANRRRKNEKRKSTASRRAAEHKTGHESTVVAKPDGMEYWEPKAGTRVIDIVPFTAGKGNPWAEEGELHYERTFWKYFSLGPDENDYIAAGKTFKKPDFIAEYAAELRRKPDHDKDLAKSLYPKERQLFMVYDHGQEEKGVQLWETSFHTFGKLLDERINNADETDEDESEWRYFYYPGASGADDGGLTLKVTFTDEDIGRGKPWCKATAIDFKKRKSPLPDDILKQAVCLDELLVYTPYDEMKKIFLQEDDSEEDDTAEDDTAEDDTAPAKESRGKRDASPAEEQEEAPEEDDAQPATDDEGGDDWGSDDSDEKTAVGAGSEKSDSDDWNW